MALAFSDLIPTKYCDLKQGRLFYINQATFEAKARSQKASEDTFKQYLSGVRFPSRQKIRPDTIVYAIPARKHSEWIKAESDLAATKAELSAATLRINGLEALVKRLYDNMSYRAWSELSEATQSQVTEVVESASAREVYQPKLFLF